MADREILPGKTWPSGDFPLCSAKLCRREARYVIRYHGRDAMRMESPRCRSHAAIYAERFGLGALPEVAA